MNNRHTGTCASAALKNAIDADLAGLDVVIHELTWGSKGHAVAQVTDPLTHQTTYLSWGEKFHSMEGFRQQLRKTGGADKTYTLEEYVADYEQLERGPRFVAPQGWDAHGDIDIWRYARSQNPR